MGTNVDELVRQIRTEANAQVARPPEELKSTAGANGYLDRLRAFLGAARRAQDKLPPVTSYRHGFIARLELWVKRRLKTATRWFTWEQVNFNAATVNSLESTALVLAQMERALADLRATIDSRGDLATDRGSGAGLEARLAVLENSVQSLLKQIQAERYEQTRRIDLLIEEQRVCLKQLALQISEIAVVSDRGKRNLQTQLDELARQVEDLSSKEKAATESR